MGSYFIVTWVLLFHGCQAGSVEVREVRWEGAVRAEESLVAQKKAREEIDKIANNPLFTDCYEKTLTVTRKRKEN